ncbi:flagellar biosynthesis anti-sigma factor FlgM [Salibacterium qingdaonense]|uniref:Negative regulator of flagellin synthesis n=1 Tax=Salibacterium qingdaonense TaxID=266892 RepID=A0A1I4L0P5_9BACI|nr:flagellar biosynthesis anti-sigma factor FlgM [Salibacterium qingdaonense]SFL84501.1 anti-sigma-28 factor, FlgM family [Salibacterium qingdaonense]
MNINPLGSVNNPYQKQADAQPQGKPETQQQEKDKVEISNQAKQMQQSGDIETARSERIEELKNEVRSGSYKFDAQESAQKFLDFWSGK